MHAACRHQSAAPTSLLANMICCWRAVRYYARGHYAAAAALGRRQLRQLAAMISGLRIAAGFDFLRCGRGYILGRPHTALALAIYNADFRPPPAALGKACREAGRALYMASIMMIPATLPNRAARFHFITC